MDGRAEGDADADFAGLLRDVIGNEGEDSDRAEQQGQRRHRGKQGDLDALRGEGLGHRSRML